MKILIVTDAWHPQVNGVVTTLSNVTKELIKAGHQVDIVEPSLFKSIPLIGYSEIKIAIETNQLKKYILNETYDYIHISTEGPKDRVFSKLGRISSSPAIIFLTQ